MSTKQRNVSNFYQTVWNDFPIVNKSIAIEIQTSIQKLYPKTRQNKNLSALKFTLKWDSIDDGSVVKALGDIPKQLVVQGKASAFSWREESH